MKSWDGVSVSLLVGPAKPHGVIPTARNETLEERDFPAFRREKRSYQYSRIRRHFAGPARRPRLENTFGKRDCKVAGEHAGDLTLSEGGKKSALKVKSPRCSPSLLQSSASCQCYSSPGREAYFSALRRSCIRREAVPDAGNEADLQRTSLQMSPVGHPAEKDDNGKKSQEDQEQGYRVAVVERIFAPNADGPSIRRSDARTRQENQYGGDETQHPDDAAAKREHRHMYSPPVLTRLKKTIESLPSGDPASFLERCWGWIVNRTGDGDGRDATTR